MECVFAEVATVGAVPLVVLLDQDVAGQVQERGGVGEGDRRRRCSACSPC